MSEGPTRGRYGLGFCYVLLALALYVGAYYCLVEWKLPSLHPSAMNYLAGGSYFHSTPPVIPLATGRPVYTTSETVNDLLTALFGPMHSFDRWFRPTHWQDVPGIP